MFVSKMLMNHRTYLYYLHVSHQVYENKGEGALIHYGKALTTFKNINNDARINTK